MVKTGLFLGLGTSYSQRFSDCVETPSKPTFSVTLADIMYHNEEQFSSIPTVDWECSLQKYKSVAQPTPAAWINSIRSPIWRYTQTLEEALPSRGFPYIPLEKIRVDSKHLAASIIKHNGASGYQTL